MNVGDVGLGIKAIFAPGINGDLRIRSTGN